MALVQKTDTPPMALQRILAAHEGSLRKAIAKNMDSGRLIRVAVNAMHRTPALWNCTMSSIVNSVVLSGVLGLEPNTPLQHAYLIPYGKECTFQPGYRGLMHLAHRTAGVKKFDPHLVFVGDEFEVEYGFHERFRHVPKDQSEDWLGAYSYVKFQDGEPSVLYMPKARILKVRDTFSKAYQQKKESSPWTTSEDEMALKTVIKRHIKRFDLTIEIAMAAEADDQAERDMKQESFIEAEFQEIAKASEEADFQLQGSREKQDKIAEEKIKEAKAREPKGRESGDTPPPLTEEEMEAATREQLAREAAAGNGETEQPQRARRNPFGGR